MGCSEIDSRIDNAIDLLQHFKTNIKYHFYYPSAYEGQLREVQNLIPRIFEDLADCDRIEKLKYEKGVG